MARYDLLQALTFSGLTLTTASGIASLMAFSSFVALQCILYGYDKQSSEIWNTS